MRFGPLTLVPVGRIRQGKLNVSDPLHLPEVEQELPVRIMAVTVVKGERHIVRGGSEGIPGTRWLVGLQHVDEMGARSVSCVAEHDLPFVELALAYQQTFGQAFGDAQKD